MSPYEFAAIFMVVPIVAVGMWLNERFATIGPSIPEFEAWCSRERPLLFAIKASPQRASAFSAELRLMLGAQRCVLHGSGRFPWTQYILVVNVVHRPGDAVVRVVVESAFVRRASSRLPELEALVQRVVSAAPTEMEAVWMHTELRDGDPERGTARRGRGWLAQHDDGGLTEFQLVSTAPAWAGGPVPSTHAANQA